jgi:ribonuclease HII
MPIIYPTLNYETELWKFGYMHIAGIDEAGRGALAGPVYAAAVIFPNDPLLLNKLHAVRDSKLMSSSNREKWAPHIRAASLAWAVGSASSREIDTLGIISATKLAATRALDALSTPPLFLLTDYLIFPNIELPQIALVKGDQLSLSVAAASVLAKTSRDHCMREFETIYPGYGFSRHKGYGTQIHRFAIRKQGLCEIHRKSFSIK